MRGRGLLLLVMTIPTQVKSQSESHKNSFTFPLPPGSCTFSSRSNSIPGELSYLCGSTLITDKHVVCVLFATKIFILLSQINPKPQIYMESDQTPSSWQQPTVWWEDTRQSQSCLGWVESDHNNWGLPIIHKQIVTSHIKALNLKFTL